MSVNQPPPLVDYNLFESDAPLRESLEREAEQVQELYLAGRKTEAMSALPDELIDLVSIVGPLDQAKAKIRAFRDAGVDTLIVWPVLPDHEERKEQLRLVAELAKESE